jgi:CBS domain-containing protein
MSRWKVADVMTTEVVSVGDEASFLEIVELLQGQDVSGVPVVDPTGRVVGVVSEADLLPKMEYAGTAKGRPLFESRRHHAVRGKATAELVHDVMTAPAVTVQPSASIVEAARMMDSAAVKRLPVVDEFGRLIGIVTRHDLLRVFLRSDREIRDDVRAELRQVPGVEPSEVRVEIARGIVTLTGELSRLSQVSIVVRLAERVDGVIEVVSHLTFRYSDVEPAAITFL